MATTSPDNIWTQDSADNYDLVIDAAATAASVQAALTARANSYTGTTTQREAFTATAPEGTLWSDTNGDKILWIKQGASWQRVWPTDDTGWVNVPLRSGISSQGLTPFQVRRIGSVVYPRWGFSGTGISASSSIDVADIPAGFRPPLTTYLAVAGHSAASMAMGSIGNTGVVNLRTAPTAASYYIFAIPWRID